MCTFLNRKLLKCENMEEFTLRTGNQSEGFSNFPPALVNRHENSTPLSSFEIYDAPDKFDSTFYPWGDYIFGCVLIIIGELFVIFGYFTSKFEKIKMCVDFNPIANALRVDFSTG